MKEIPSLLRLEEDRALSQLSVAGSILDLGGDKNSAYAKLIGGVHTFTTVNIAPKLQPDIVHDLEEILPIGNEMYDHTLLINVLEHVFLYRQLLTEASRVTKDGGTLVIIVPFLFPIHPSPLDYWRFTEMTLRRELEHAGLRNIHVTPLGAGVCSARYLFLDRLLPRPLRFINFWTGRYIALLCDALLLRLSRVLHKKYNPADYALGYIAIAKK